MSKHTPGPWVADVRVLDRCYSPTGELVCEQKECVILGGGGYAICEVLGLRAFDQNVSIIVSAPEMFEMIVALFCDQDGEPCFQGSEGDREYMRQVLKKARGD